MNTSTPTTDRKWYTFEHKDGMTKSMHVRLFIAGSMAEAQHYAAIHTDGTPLAISEWTDSEVKTYLSDGNNPAGLWTEVFSGRGAKVLHVRDASEAAKGSPVGYRRARQWWVEAAKGQRQHAGYGYYREPATI